MKTAKYTKTIIIRLTPSVFELITIQSKKVGMSKSDFIRIVLITYSEKLTDILLQAIKKPPVD